MLGWDIEQTKIPRSPHPSPPRHPLTHTPSFSHKQAAEALRLLKVGNAAFLRDEVAPKQRSDRHIGLHFAQKPHAIIIACSDSRVPPEMIFNCAFGELYVYCVEGSE